MAKENNSNFEAQLFKAADKLRKNIDAAEYKNVALGLIFLKYISESFQELYEKLAQDEFSDPEDRDEYKAENIFFVPEKARWKNLQAKAKLPTIGQELDDAMESIEKENPELRNVLPKVFGKPNLDKTSLGQLIDLISDTELKSTSANSKDLFGRVYEYFLGEFANAEGKKGGQFYTPKSIVKLMVEMIEPYKGRIYDPACGSSGMFVMSEKFILEHSGNIKDITIYGQESNQTTWKLSKMNLAIRNINSQFIAWNTEGSFLKDAHPDLKADYILANPPFNQSDWGQEILQDDARWKYGVPPAGNANFAWMQHMLYHLAHNGVMATVLANGSLSSNTSGEGEIRKNLIENDLVECIVALPKQLFYNTGIPACIWFLRRERASQPPKGGVLKSPSGDLGAEILFIDASEMGFLKDRVHREFTDEDINKISDTYHKWRTAPQSPKGEVYRDIKGFCKSAKRDEVEKHGFVLTPGRYVGITDAIDDGIPFEEKMEKLTAKLKEQFEKEEVMNAEIKRQLAKIGFEI
jgi:type I restriction enzyme M protein